MKTTFKILLLPLVLALLFIRCGKEEPETKVEISDVNFLNALIENGVDIDGDGQISIGEADRVSSLDVSSCNISNLSSIEQYNTPHFLFQRSGLLS